MWFVLALTALAVVVVSGLYVRRRVAEALAALGVRERRVRIVRWVMGWLILAFPVAMVTVILGRLLFGMRLPRFDGLVAVLLFTLPFAWAMLIAIQSVLWV